MKPAPCSKAQSGKCLGGACANHVGSCRGRSNVRTRTAPPQNTEDAMIEALDRHWSADEIAEALFAPAA